MYRLERVLPSIPWDPSTTYVFTVVSTCHIDCRAAPMICVAVLLVPSVPDKMMKIGGLHEEVTNFRKMIFHTCNTAC